MPQVNVTIAGRTYRMACGEGEDAHLTRLAARLDDRIGSLRGEFGEIGDQRITVMAAITIADELAEAEGRIAALQAEKAAIERERQALSRQIDAAGHAVASAIDGVAAGIDQVARDLSAKSGRAKGGG